MFAFAVSRSQPGGGGDEGKGPAGRLAGKAGKRHGAPMVRGPLQPLKGMRPMVLPEQVLERA